MIQLKETISVEMNETLKELRKELNTLATEDFSDVVASLSKIVERKVRDNPYATIAASLGIGFGLSALNLNHARSAAIRIGKLVAMKTLSNMETSAQQSPQSVGQSGAKSSAETAELTYDESEGNEHVQSPSKRKA